MLPYTIALLLANAYRMWLKVSDHVWKENGAITIAIWIFLMQYIYEMPN